MLYRVHTDPQLTGRTQNFLEFTGRKGGITYSKVYKEVKSLFVLCTSNIYIVHLLYLHWCTSSDYVRQSFTLRFKEPTVTSGGSWTRANGKCDRLIGSKRYSHGFTPVFYFPSSISIDLKLHFRCTNTHLTIIHSWWRLFLHPAPSTFFSTKIKGISFFYATECEFF